MCTVCAWNKTKWVCFICCLFLSSHGPTSPWTFWTDCHLQKVKWLSYLTRRRSQSPQLMLWSDAVTRFGPVWVGTPPELHQQQLLSTGQTKHCSPPSRLCLFKSIPGCWMWGLWLLFLYQKLLSLLSVSSAFPDVSYVSSEDICWSKITPR